MKRCPQCNRVEPDNTLAFCRFDGAALVIEYGSISEDTGTVRFAAPSVATETPTSVLPQQLTNPSVVAPTTVLPSQPITTNTRQLRDSNRSLWIAVLGLLVIVGLVAGVYVYWSRSKKTTAIQSIAVMPFVNASGNSELDYLSDGVTETLIQTLSQLPNLNVKSRSSVFRYKGKETDAKTIGKELNVEAILNGRVVQRGEQLTLNLELINAQTENVIWTDQYDRKSSDLVALQNVIAREVSSKLKIQLSGDDLEKLAKKYTNDPEAYRLYLQGRFYWNKRVGPDFERAESYFQQAVARDPNFALGYVGLADFKEDNDRPRKKEYIRRALEIDDQLAEAHASLGYQYMVDHNWAESERELKRAIELNPKYPQAHQWNGARLMMNGKFDEARASLTRALELDPTSPGINLYYAAFLEVSGKYDECVLHSKKLIEDEPTYSWAYISLVRCYRLKGDHAASVEAHARSLELLGNEAAAGAMRESFAKGGWQGYLRYVVETSPTRTTASYLAELGEYDKAVDAIVKQSDLPIKFWFFMNRTDPFLDPIRDDPRVKEAMKVLDPPQ
jgi:TolB-like protein/Tfp pilus assembly protein PilF